MTKSRTTRRSFLGTSAALTTGVGFWSTTAPKAHAQTSALQAPAAGCIGVGGKGGGDTAHLARAGVSIAGICDVDRARLTKNGRKHTDAEQFQDYREMYEALGDKIDIVLVSTPDHTHASAAIRAMRLGKHVYCQKPLTWSIGEARMMRETAAETGVVTQMGNQGTASNRLREAVEVIQAGTVGDVSDVHIWSNRPVWPQGIGRPKDPDPVPEFLDWESWIGPAPMRPYKEGVYHSFNWRGWVDFGTGALGDMACHTTNLSVMALKLWDPIAVTAIKNPGIFEGETFPASSQLMFEFPERDGLAPCRFHWYDGGNLPPDEILSQLPADFQKQIETQKKDPNRKTSGAVIVGSKGLLFSPDDYGERYFLLPEDRFVDFKIPEPSIPRIPYKKGNDERQKWEFVKTITGEYESGTTSNFGYAGRLTETILVGNLAMRGPEGRRIEWDAKNLKSTNVPEVNQFVAREYRAGWEL